MKRTNRPRRRPSIHITKARASRLYRLVTILAKGPQSRENLLAAFDVGLRTLYREFELLKRCGVKVRLVDRCYTLVGTLEDSEGLLPFPDPLLSFSELAELAQGPGPAARRLAQLLKSVTEPPAPKTSRKAARKANASK